jgi:hypothetical protein
MINHKLAYELASTLNDTDSLKAYEEFTDRYAEDFLRKILAKVMSIPDRKIKKTRGALFTYLANQNGRRHHSGD